MIKAKIFAVFIALLLVASGPVAAQFNAFEDPTQPGGPSAGGGGGGAPNLEPVKAEVSGGEVALGGSAKVITLFKNPGGGIVDLRNITLYPSSNVQAKISRNQCSEEPLTPGAECAITLEITALQAGSWRVEMLIEHTGRTRLTTARVAGNVVVPEGDNQQGQGELISTPSEINFENLNAPTSIVRSVTLRNKTSLPIKILDVKIDSTERAGFDLNNSCGGELSPGEGCIIAVTWTPRIKGPVEGMIVVNHSGDSKVNQITIKGNYQPDQVSAATLYPDAVPGKGLLVSDKASIEFGEDIDGAAAITATLVNVGDTTLTLKSIRLSGSDNGVSVSRDGCRAGLELKPVEACPMTVNWLPSREGPVIDDIQIRHTGARGILVLPLRGTATKAVAPSLSFRKSTRSNDDGGGNIETKEQTIMPVLDGYVVTSHAQDRAVVSGPVGSQIIRDGATVVLAGVQWSARVIPAGVRLINDQDEVLLVFDNSLSTNRFVRSSSNNNTNNDTDNN